MNLKRMLERIQSNTNDKTGSIFTSTDMISFINEGIDRMSSNPYFRSESYLTVESQSPVLIPSAYHYLLPVYATARCFAQDERHYQATNFMNEFEVKFEELVKQIDSGEIVIKDATGNEVVPTYAEDFVTHTYFKYGYDTDLDEGVEGVD